MNFPLSLTKSELHSFNKLWQSLSQEDRAAFNDLLRTALQNSSSTIPASAYLSYQTLMVYLLIEEYKEVKRLRRKVDELQTPGWKEYPA